MEPGDRSPQARVTRRLPTSASDAARASLSRTRRTLKPPQAHTNPFKMVKMVESAEEFKALKMGDKPVRASPPRALPGSFSSRCQLGRQGFFRPVPPPDPSESSTSAKIPRDAPHRATTAPPIHRARSPAPEIRPPTPGSPRGPEIFFE